MCGILSELTAEDLKKIILGILLFVGFIGGGAGLLGVRPGKWSEADAHKSHAALKEDIFQARSQIMDEVDFIMKQHHLAIPPEPTRQRIKAIEVCLERKCTDFIAPTQRWYD